jgi:hypothetical protein
MPDGGTATYLILSLSFHCYVYIQIQILKPKSHPYGFLTVAIQKVEKTINQKNNSIDIQ